jgi:hypothetical protein
MVGTSASWCDLRIHRCAPQIMKAAPTTRSLREASTLIDLGTSSKVKNGHPCKFLKGGREDYWSGREDLNLRPPGPEPGALPG